jgi:hypothetical protein
MRAGDALNVRPAVHHRDLLVPSDLDLVEADAFHWGQPCHNRPGTLGSGSPWLPARDANDFASLFDTMMDRAYSYKLWGAAYIIHGGCSDDTLNDFRSSLISRGRSCFGGAIAGPDSLADEPFDESAWFYEGYQYAVAAGVKVVAPVI